MKRVWLIRKDQGAVSPVIATILMVAITVVLAAVLYVMVGAFIDQPDGNKTVVFHVSSSGDNWAMLVSSITGGTISLESATFRIFDSDGFIQLGPVKLSDLTQDNWETHKAYYQQKGTEDILEVGGRILVDKETYPAGYTYDLMDDTAILATGTF